MAQQLIVTLICDLTGDPAAETVAFGLDGVGYEIDLTDVKAKELREALAPYVEAGRRAGKTRGKQKAPAASDARAVRAWCVENGVPVNAKGRVNSESRAAYRKAHGLAA